MKQNYRVSMEVKVRIDAVVIASHNVEAMYMAHQQLMDGIIKLDDGVILSKKIVCADCFYHEPSL